MRKFFLLGLSVLFFSCNTENPDFGEVKVSGAMKNVMWKGELEATIDLDTLPQKENLYGVGPVEYLQGEIMVLDGKAYKSTVVSDTAMAIEETFQVKAPFFVYANAKEWAQEKLPDSIKNISNLEKYLEQHAQLMKPFVFKLEGTVKQAAIHVLNLNDRATVNSPEDAHHGQVPFELLDEQVDILGFYSTEHQGIFTHHDSYLHMHLINKDRTKMGHLDRVDFSGGEMTLYLPKE